jgi:hypothetical protein
VGGTKPVLEFVLLMSAQLVLVEALVQKVGRVLVVEQALVEDYMRVEY